MRIVPITIYPLGQGSTPFGGMLLRRSKTAAPPESEAARGFLLILEAPEPSEAYEMPTLFEKIIAGELPATVIFRDSQVIAFLDIRPAAPVHILIVPHKPIPTTDDIEDGDAALLGHMIIVARDLARKQGIAKSGYRLVINCNPDSGQEVYHLHLHLLGGRPLGPLLQRA
ncbi:MAG: histidine triad nucleotide-binding protein [Steroidobacteraceae bacterium]